MYSSTSAGTARYLPEPAISRRVWLRAKYADPHFLLNVHRLRAIAILFIVTIHCTYFLDWKHHPLEQAFFNDFFDNSTILFVFISGFLFQHLGARFEHKKYLKTKILNVGLPYLVAALPAIVYALITGEAAQRFSELQGHSSLYIGGWLLMNGGAHLNYALWFMPVIFIYYLAAPLFRSFYSQPKLYWLLLLLIPFSLFAHRPTYDHGHNLILALYFLPVYLLGMLFSQYRHRMEGYLNNYLPIIAVGYAAVLFGHFFLADHHGKYTVEQLFSFRHGLFDWLFLQQILMALTLYGLVKKCDGADLRWLDFIGEISFTMYFIHLYILHVLKHLTRNYDIAGNVTSVMFLLVITVLISSAIALVNRRIFGRYSRAVLGS